MVIVQDLPEGSSGVGNSGQCGLFVYRHDEAAPPDGCGLRLLVLGAEAPNRNLDAFDLVIASAGSAAAARREVVGVEVLDDAVESIAGTLNDRPHASSSLALLLRVSSTVDVAEGLVLESQVYSALLAGEEFATWLTMRGAPRTPDGSHRVVVDRPADQLLITLDRPMRRNAYDSAMRDQFLEALEIAHLDPSVRVSIRGAGPDFCAGGDLDEFGTARDFDAAHRTRVTASPGARIHLIRDRVTAEIHGNAVGSGIEIAAFAGTVRATADARFALPEVAMGLIPGAGGTVSLSRRMGRHRLLWWALSGAILDAATAYRWGLVDELVD